MKKKCIINITDFHVSIFDCGSWFASLCFTGSFSHAFTHYMYMLYTLPNDVSVYVCKILYNVFEIDKRYLSFKSNTTYGLKHAMQKLIWLIVNFARHKRYLDISSKFELLNTVFWSEEKKLIYLHERQLRSTMLRWVCSALVSVLIPPSFKWTIKTIKDIYWLIASTYNTIISYHYNSLKSGCKA